MAPIPENEELRLETLRRYRILDSLSEKAFDDIAVLLPHAELHRVVNDHLAAVVASLREGRQRGLQRQTGRRE